MSNKSNVNYATSYHGTSSLRGSSGLDSRKIGDFYDFSSKNFSQYFKNNCL